MEGKPEDAPVRTAVGWTEQLTSSRRYDGCTDGSSDVARSIQSQRHASKPVRQSGSRPHAVASEIDAGGEAAKSVVVGP